jgi:hypothetical protein
VDVNREKTGETSREKEKTTVRTEAKEVKTLVRGEMSDESNIQFIALPSTIHELERAAPYH